MAQSFYPITGTNPTALSTKEEFRLARRWKRTKDVTCRDTLIKNYLLFTVKIVKRSYSTLAEDDVVLVAHEALLGAIEKFDPNRKKIGRLFNLIPYSVKAAFRNFRRRAETVRHPVKTILPEGGRYQTTTRAHPDWAGDHQESDELKGVAPADEVNTLDELFGNANSAAENYDLAERKEAILDAIESLPEGLQVIMNKVYFENLSFAEIARQNKPPITREAIRQKHNHALSLLREAIKRKGISHS